MTIKDRIVTTIRSILPGGKNKKKAGKSDDEFENLKKEVTIDEHKITLEELIDRYQTDIERGLSNEKSKRIIRKKWSQFIDSTS